jgi:hypothetical protein
MLDPELIDQLAAHPEKNAAAVNLALAEEGHGTVLLSLAESSATAADALEVVGRRMQSEGPALDPPVDEDDDDGPRIRMADELERLLVAHPNAPAHLRDAILEAHADESFFVLAAASHPRATTRAVERAATWPSPYAVFDRRWLQTIAPSALSPLGAEEWAQDPDPLLRETVARLTNNPSLLAGLSRDASRRVRRAVASNIHAVAERARLAVEDPAPEVRARAAGELSAHEAGALGVSSARFAAALRAMDSGGVLAPDTSQALSGSMADLDEEGAMLAAQVLPPALVVALIRDAVTSRAPNAGGLAAGLALRSPDDEEAFRDLVAEATKALSDGSVNSGNLTGKARLAAWLGDGLAACGCIDRERLLASIPKGALGAETPVLSRSAAIAPPLLSILCSSTPPSSGIPASVLQLAWHAEVISDETVIAMASCVRKAKKRGQDLPDDELDLDPSRRSLEVLERVVLAVHRQAVLSPRAALPVVALDSRRVRYVLTALPTWKGSLRGSMLGRVLRQRAGALSAGRSEARSRAGHLKDWTQRMLNDTEVGVALAVGHFTADELVRRMGQGRHRVEDGASVAAGAETRAVLEGPQSVAPLLKWARREKGAQPAALAMWLLLEGLDRSRPAGQIASSVDTLARAQRGVAHSVSEALALLERREPGRLERVFPQTPHGRATLASAIARAYRAVGGLRAER